MGNIKFFNINEVKLQNMQYRNSYNINTQNLYPFLLIGVSVTYSKRYLCLTNEKAVFIYTLDEIIDMLKLDKKFVDYLYLQDAKDISIKLEQNEEFDTVLVQEIFKNASSVNITPEAVSDEYMLNHYLKKSCKIELKQILESQEEARKLDPKGYLYSLLETQLNLHVININYNNKKLLWAYFNIQEDGGFYYPILHIADYQTFVVSGNLKYNRYFIPKEVLKAIISSSSPLELNADKSDFIPINQICSICKFNPMSKLHEAMCDLYSNV